MVTKKEVSFSQGFSFIGFIQQLLAVIIAVLFFVGLIPFSYSELGKIIIVLIVIQALLSLVRLNIAAFLYELFLLLIGILSFIPFLGYVFRVVGFLGFLIDIVVHSNDSRVVRKINIVNTNFGNSSKEDKKYDKNVYEAEYKEK